MLGLGTSLVKGGMAGRQYVKDGLKLYMPYKKRDGSLQFVGTGSTSFDGSNDYIDCGDDTSLDITSAITLSMWVKPDAVNDQVNPVGRDDGTNRNYYMYFDTGDAKAYWFMYISGVSKETSSTSDMVVGEWMHICGTYDGARQKLYINGVLEDDDAETGSIDNDDVSFSIGAREAGADRFFDGSMKNVAIWERALTATEVQNVMYKSYAEVSGRLANGLVSWWALDVDYTDYHGDNDGTNSGSTLDTDLYGGDTPVKPRAIDNAPTVQADAIGAGSASFNGSNDGDEIVCGNDSSLAINGDMTVTAWLNPTNATDTAGIIVKRDVGGTNYQFDIPTDRKFRVYDGAREAKSATALTLGEWAHVAFTIDSGQAGGTNCYINGVNDALTFDSGTTITITSDDANLVLGHNEADGSNGHYGGYMSQVGLWSRALTQAEIQSVMEKTYEELTASEKTNLVSYWALDVDGSDSHGDNDGTLT